MWLSRKARRPRLSFEKLAQRQAFSKIIRLLQDDRYDLEGWLFDSNNENAALNLFRGESPLHRILQWKPPVELVDALIGKLLEYRPTVVPEEARDMKGRTPLHVAAACGCDVSVIVRLLQGQSVVMPAIIKDHFDRYPLHWACEFVGSEMSGGEKYSEARRSKSSSTLKIAEENKQIENMVLVILTLVRAYPEGATVRDLNGDTPLDLAKRSHTDRWIVALLEAQVKKFGLLPSAGKTTETKDESTEPTAEFEVPREVSEAYGLLDDSDDVSEMGLGGVSVVFSTATRPRVKKVTSTKSMQQQSPRLQI